MGKRHIVTFMIFLGMANAYIMRTNMSVAIVAMVNHTAVGNTEKQKEAVNECGNLSNETESDFKHVSNMLRSYSKLHENCNYITSTKFYDYLS